MPPHQPTPEPIFQSQNLLSDNTWIARVITQASPQDRQISCSLDYSWSHGQEIPTFAERSRTLSAIAGRERDNEFKHDTDFGLVQITADTRVTLKGDDSPFMEKAQGSDRKTLESRMELDTPNHGHEGDGRSSTTLFSEFETCPSHDNDFECPINFKHRLIRWIEQMMFVSGETAEPSPETTWMIEEIVREQVLEMVCIVKCI